MPRRNIISTPENLSTLMQYFASNRHTNMKTLLMRKQEVDVTREQDSELRF